MGAKRVTMGLEAYSTDSIKNGSALGGSILSNAFGIPFDKFRVLVAQDVKCASGLNKHFFATFASPKEAFTGGFTDRRQEGPNGSVQWRWRGMAHVKDGIHC